MTFSFSRLLLLLAVGGGLLFILPDLAVAQQDPLAGLTETGMSQQTKDYGRTGYPRVRVYLWGNADNGVWTVEEGTDLLEFLSAAATGNFNQGTDTRVKNYLKVYREGQKGEDPVFEMRVQEIFARQNDVFELQNGDVLVVESVQRRRIFTLRGIAQMTGSIASIASFVFLIRR